jgi:hypothetical protein
MTGTQNQKREWRCTGCQKLLGMVTSDRLHIRLSREHEYRVGVPASAICRKCGTLNELGAIGEPQHTASDPKAI